MIWSKKSRNVLIYTFAFVILVVFVAVALNRYIERGRAERHEQRVMEAYFRVNSAFGLASGLSRDFYYQARYIPLRAGGSEQNRFGIWVNIYLRLRMFEDGTGLYLAYEDFLDYFSQEFEVDGSLRLYNNGKHPEIEKFVEWIWKHLNEVDDFIVSIQRKYINYCGEFENEGFERQSFSELSPQMLDALVRAHNNPNYVLDLTSLQKQGY